MERFYILNKEQTEIIALLNLNYSTDLDLDVSNSSTALIQYPENYTTIKEFVNRLRWVIRSYNSRDGDPPKYKYQIKIYHKAILLCDFLGRFSDKCVVFTEHSKFNHNKIGIAKKLKKFRA